MTIYDEIKKLDKAIDLPDGLVSVICDLAGCAEKIHERLPQYVSQETSRHSSNASGDEVIEADIVANELCLKALKNNACVGAIISEESKNPILTKGCGYGIAIDPLDGSKALKYNIPTGTIFSIFSNATEIEQFSGPNSIASGFFIYGVKFEFFLCVADQVFCLSQVDCRKLTTMGTDAPFVCTNYSNVQNQKSGWRNFFIDEIFSEAKSGEINTRWFGSLVLHIKTLIVSGGLFAYPPDNRTGYEKGHLRLIYEAIPMAMIIETLGGKATNGTDRILSMVPKRAHEKTPLAIGQKEFVDRLMRSITSSQEPK
ncbi:MAG: class 1 fructose-bisphosphatase [Marinosulfonomonas sp.]